MGPNGLRAGWRFLMYLAMTAVLGFPYRLIHHWISPGPRPHTIVLHPDVEVYGSIARFVLAALPAVVMARIERERWGHYGLALRRAFRSEFWFGALWGIGGLSVIMMCLWLAHFYTIEGVALHGIAILKYGGLWAIAMLFVGLFEEFSLRGYPQYTLASGMGFWPAALLLSLVFMAGHLGNGGETWLGLIDVFLFGMFASFTLWRTGNLWFAVGVHAAWDWGLTFLYSGPNSGLLATGQLLKTRFSGPTWLSGGSAGPEGSAINVAFDVLWFILFAFVYRKRQWIGMNDRRQAATSAPEILVDGSALSG